ncbi:auxin-responsive protein SAUR71-like [Mangifera indica]|uniref:auxin-responsive protein SAUR71-like n=1 Tax=Mangifera indica TaxID=29780 RepID=UPI001CFB7C0F|nr:auxin-responsive protein SAUR71-like [Mangifera indica]
MDVMSKAKEKKANLILKTWERCKSIGRSSKLKRSVPVLTVKDASSASLDNEEDHHQKQPKLRKRRVAPEGCFSVYVGPQKQRFVIKTEYVNHPLFNILLEEAESEYGFNSEGPLKLPCKVEVFYKVLTAMDAEKDEIRQGCGFPGSHSSYRLLSQSRMITINHF